MNLLPCISCRRPSSGRHALPTHNGDIVSNDFPLDTANHPCCERCYKLHESGLIVTYDRPYVEPAALHTQGSGI